MSKFKLNKLFSDKERIIDNKTEHELNVINSFESALIEQHNLAQNELLQQSHLINQLPSQQQPVIVNPSSTKFPRISLDNNGKSCIYVFFLSILILIE